MDYQRFERRLGRLDEAAWLEKDNIRELVHELVPEYHYRAEGGCRRGNDRPGRGFGTGCRRMEPGYGERILGRSLAYDTEAGAGSPVKSRMALTMQWQYTARNKKQQ
ncbi:MAG: hypothetical protein ACLTW9_22945 [Enterocloster sp.]